MHFFGTPGIYLIDQNILLGLFTVIKTSNIKPPFLYPKSNLEKKDTKNEEYSHTGSSTKEPFRRQSADEANGRFIDVFKLLLQTFCYHSKM